MDVVIVKGDSAKVINTVRDSLVISSPEEKRGTQKTHERKTRTSYIITSISSVGLIHNMTDLLVEPT